MSELYDLTSARRASIRRRRATAGALVVAGVIGLAGVNPATAEAPTATPASPGAITPDTAAIRSSDKVLEAKRAMDAKLRSAMPATAAFGNFGEYTPLTPSRLMDSRNGMGGLQGGTEREVQITGLGGVPGGNVQAVVLNVTVDGPSNEGFLSVFPTGQPRPAVSNLNFVPGQTVANAVTVKVGLGGKVNLFNSNGWVDTIVDVVGYYSDVNGNAGGRFTPSSPSRILDTRAGAKPAAGSTRQIAVKNAGGVPLDATSVVLNLTADGPAANGFVTVYPADVARPDVSNLNYRTNRIRANLVTVRLPANGLINLYTLVPAHLIVDVMGWYTEVRVGDRGRFVAFDEPGRIFDSREDFGPGLPVPPDPCCPGWAVDTGANAMALNVTAVDAWGPGFVVAHPADAPKPNSSNLNYEAGEIVPNLVVVGSSNAPSTHFGGALIFPEGSVAVRTGVSPAHVVVDYFGGFMRV